MRNHATRSAAAIALAFADPVDPVVAGTEEGTAQGQNEAGAALGASDPDGAGAAEGREDAAAGDPAPTPEAVPPTFSPDCSAPVDQYPDPADQSAYDRAYETSCDTAFDAG